MGAAAVGIGYALNQKVIPAVDLFGKEVSDATKKSITAYMDLDNKAGIALLSFKANNTVITGAIAKDTVATFETMGAQIKAGRDKNYAEDLANLTKFYADQGLLESKDAQYTLGRMKEEHEVRTADVNKFVKDIATINEKASSENRALTQREADAIAAIEARMRAMAIETLTNSEKEQEAILTRMRLQAGNIALDQASDVIGASAKQRDETTKLANDQYEKIVATITRQRNEGVILSDDEAKKKIDAAERARVALIEKAKDTHERVVYELQQQNNDVAKQINETDGTIKTWWQKLGDWFSSHAIKYNLEYNGPTSASEYNGPTSLYNNASGTSNFRGGLTTMHEKGYEVYNLPGGSRIYNHEASEDMVLKTAQEVARGVIGSNGGGANINGPIYVTVQADDLKQVGDVLDLFRRLPQVARAGG